MVFFKDLTMADPSAAGTTCAVGPIELVVLQGTSFCNLNCSYCYISADRRREKSVLSLEALETIFTKILGSRYLGPDLQITWHSGEPLVLSPAYYAAAIDLIQSIRQQCAATACRVHFSIQTNGTLLNPQWCDLFAQYRDVLSVGVSCDGPAFLHDAHRINWAGKPTHKRTEAAMRLLADRGIAHDVIAVVSADGLRHPEALLAYFAPFAHNIREFHFNLHDDLALERNDAAAIRRYADDYAGFLRRLLKMVDRGPEQGAFPRIRNFSAFYERLFAEGDARVRYDARAMSHPFKSLTVQANGDVATFYAGLDTDDCADLYGDGRGLMVGNLLREDLERIAHSAKLARIWHDFERSHQTCEAGCEYYDVCSGGYNLVKIKRHGTFDAAETPECRIHVMTFADTMLDELRLGAARPMTLADEGQ